MKNASALIDGEGTLAIELDSQLSVDDDLNAYPSRLLKHFASDQALLLCRSGMGVSSVVGCASLNATDLVPLKAFNAIELFRRWLDMHSLLVCVMRVTIELTERIKPLFPDLADITKEAKHLLDVHKEVLAVYVVAHTDHRPCKDLTVGIGGDCYRDDQLSFCGALERISLLARAMTRKAVMMFPDLPALHGGKKGEWMLIDARGRAISGLSEDIRIALGAVVIQRGIEFLNHFKGATSKASGLAADEVPRLMQDSASPDTLSGKYWTPLCDAWRALGLDGTEITCLPQGEVQVGAGDTGRRIEGASLSAIPTGNGVAATTVQLCRRLFRKPLSQCRFLVEALGNVSYYTLDTLINRYGVSPEQIVAFDLDASACERVLASFPGVTVWREADKDFYARAEASEGFDVWINNGLGNRTASSQVGLLLDKGVRIFCGGANNIFLKAEEANSLKAIWARGGWAWPDEATSGGGWTFAVMDLYFRTLGQPIQIDSFLERVNDYVRERNVAFVDAVIDGGPVPSGAELWRRIEDEISRRLLKSAGRGLSREAMLAAADIRRWGL